MSSFNMW